MAHIAYLRNLSKAMNIQAGLLKLIISPLEKGMAIHLNKIESCLVQLEPKLFKRRYYTFMHKARGKYFAL